MKSVLYSCPFVPPEWIAAHALEPRRFIGQPSQDGPVAALAGMCPFALRFINQACATNCAAAVFTTLCDPMRRGAELAQTSGASVPLFLMNVPATWQNVQSRQLYATELRRLGKFLQSIGGEPPSDSTLSATLLHYQARRQTILNTRPAFSAAAFARALMNISAAPAVAETHQAQPTRGGGTKVALVGGPLCEEDLWLHDFIEQRGGRVTLDASENVELCLPQWPERKQIERDPFAAMVHAYFDALPHPARRPNDAFYAWLGAALARSGAQGIIYRYYVWCDSWHAEAARVREAISLPMLELGIAEDETPSRLGGRVESFLEMLQGAPH